MMTAEQATIHTEEFFRQLWGGIYSSTPTVFYKAIDIDADDTAKPRKSAWGRHKTPFNRKRKLTEKK